MNVGSIVFHKELCVLMTVEHIGEKINCVWFNDQSLQRQDFKPEELEEQNIDSLSVSLLYETPPQLNEEA